MLAAAEARRTWAARPGLDALRTIESEFLTPVFLTTASDWSAPSAMLLGLWTRATAVELDAKTAWVAGRAPPVVRRGASRTSPR